MALFEERLTLTEDRVSTILSRTRGLLSDSNNAAVAEAFERIVSESSIPLASLGEFERSTSQKLPSTSIQYGYGASESTASLALERYADVKVHMH